MTELGDKIDKYSFKPWALIDRVSQVLTEAILDGTLKHGEKLVETGPRKRLGISRTPLREASRVAAAAAFKEVVDIPVIAVGRINTPELAAEVLDEGSADLVAVGRQFIADAHWPNKAKEGRLGDIRTCIACNIGCIDRLLLNRLPITCTVNPVVAREGQDLLPPATEKKKLVVVGAGPAGLAAAVSAAVRGHQAVVLEKSGRIGGQLHLAGAAPGKSEYITIINYYAAQIDKLGVELSLNCEADAALIQGLAPDMVALATGGRPKRLAEPWASADMVCDAWQVLDGSVEAGNKVVIVGGNRMGLETAEFLLDRGREVIVVEQAPRIGSELGVTVRPVLMNRLIRSLVNVFNKARIVSVEGDAVTLDRDGDVIVLNGVDGIVLAVGTEPRDQLAAELAGLPCPVRKIGDCDQAAGILQAVAAGFELAREL